MVGGWRGVGGGDCFEHKYCLVRGLEALDAEDEIGEFPFLFEMSGEFGGGIVRGDLAGGGLNLVGEILWGGRFRRGGWGGWDRGWFRGEGVGWFSCGFRSGFGVGIEVGHDERGLGLGVGGLGFGLGRGRHGGGEFDSWRELDGDVDGDDEKAVGGQECGEGELFEDAAVADGFAGGAGIEEEGGIVEVGGDGEGHAGGVDEFLGGDEELIAAFGKFFGAEGVGGEEEGDFAGLGGALGGDDGFGVHVFRDGEPCGGVVVVAGWECGEEGLEVFTGEDADAEAVGAPGGDVFGV